MRARRWRMFSIRDGALYCGGRENNGELGQGGSHQDAVAFPTPVSAPATGLVRPQPRIVFSCTGLTCLFDGTSSQDDRGIVSYSWTFGDGTSGSGPIVTHTYAAPANQSVWLTVTDTDGQTAQMLTSLFDVNTTNRSPKVDFSVGTSASCNGPLQVWTSSLDGQIGAGGSFSTATLNIGTHTISLTATDPVGASSTASITITITNQPPVADFTITCNAVQHYCDLDANVSRDPDGSVVAYSWTAPGRPTKTTVRIRRWSTIPNSGDQYDETLDVTDDRGATARVTRRIVIP